MSADSAAVQLGVVHSAFPIPHSALAVCPHCAQEKGAAGMWRHIESKHGAAALAAWRRDHPSLTNAQRCARYQIEHGLKREGAALRKSEEKTTAAAPAPAPRRCGTAAPGCGRRGRAGSPSPLTQQARRTAPRRNPAGAAYRADPKPDTCRSFDPFAAALALVERHAALTMQIVAGYERFLTRVKQLRLDYIKARATLTKLQREAAVPLLDPADSAFRTPHSALSKGDTSDA